MKNVKYPNLLVASGWLLTVIVWITLGIVLFNHMNVHSFGRGILWLFLWNFFTFMVNTVIMFFVAKFIKE